MTGNRAILIRNARVIATCDDAMRRIERGSVLVRGNRIAAIGPADKIAPPEGAKVIDASNHVVLPGLVNTHHHLYQTLTRCLPSVQAAKLFDWLVGLYEVWRWLGPEGVYTGALVGLGELLLTGCTTTSDHHYVFPRSARTDLVGEEVRAARELGIRFHPTRGAMSRGRSQGGLPPDDVCQDEREILEDCARVIERYHDPGPFSMCRLALAPCSPFSVTADLMRETARLAREKGVRLHTHLAETLDEEQYCREVYGKRPLALMEDLGWLGPDVWFAHCVYLNDDEIRLMAETGTGVAHCPSSNMRLGSGIAPIPKMLDAGVAVGLAVDGSASNDTSDLLGECRQALLLHRVLGGAGAMAVDRVLWLATRGGARVLGRDDIGSLEPGKAADLIAVNLNRLGYAGALGDPVAALLLAGDSHIVDYSIVNGRVVVERGRLVSIDEQQVIEKANRLAGEMVARARTAV